MINVKVEFADYMMLLNAVEEFKQARKHPPKEKVEAIKVTLKYFEVI